MILLLSLALGQITEIQKIKDATDFAEKASDRWLFLFSIIIILLFSAAVIRYLVKDRETARTEHANNLKEAYAQADMARREHAATMKEMYGAQTKLAAELLVAMQENNVLIGRVEKLLEKLNEKS